MLDTALAYAARGWPVIPLHSISNGRCTCSKKVNCASPGKHPMTRHGMKDATIDATVIRQWWTRWPQANIGIRTGKESGVLVLDIDTDKGGDKSLQDLIELHAPSPDTLMQKTGSGGRHYLFACPDMPVRCNAGKLGAGLDIRANGGYIVAPPSRHISGGVYQWLNDNALAPAPDWLLVLISNERPESNDAPPGFITEGGRNDYLASIGGKLRREGKSKHEILIYLLEENHLRCTPPLDDGEVKKIADSLGRYRKGPLPKEMKYQYRDWLRSPDCPAPAPTRHILIDLTHWMNAQGRSCYPTIEDISATTGYCHATVRDRLSQAAEKGWIGRYIHKGKGQAWRNYGYFIPRDFDKKRVSTPSFVIA